MSLSTLFKHEVIIKHSTPGVADEYGQRDRTFVKDETPTKGFMQVDGKTEVPDSEGRDTVLADWRFFTFFSVQITEQDQLEWNGELYDVLGVATVQRPGTSHHKVVLLRSAGQPAVPFLREDDFNRPNADDLGSPWVMVDSLMGVQEGKAANTNSSDTTVVADVGTPFYEFEVDIDTSANMRAGVVFRAETPNDEDTLHSLLFEFDDRTNGDQTVRIGVVSGSDGVQPGSIESLQESVGQFNPGETYRIKITAGPDEIRATHSGMGVDLSVPNDQLDERFLTPTYVGLFNLEGIIGGHEGVAFDNLRVSPL